MSQLDVQYDFIAIIDCLPVSHRNDWQISEQLESYLDSEKLDSEKFKPLLKYCETTQDVIDFLIYLETLSKAGKKFVIHIVSHGNIRGIAIGNGGSFSWSDMRPYFERINEKQQNQLIINMSSCIGLAGIMMADYNAEKTPFFGLIGSAEELEVNDAIKANKLFYKFLLNIKEKNIPQVTDAIGSVNTKMGKVILQGLSAESFKAKTKAIVNALNESPFKDML